MSRLLNMFEFLDGTRNSRQIFVIKIISFNKQANAALCEKKTKHI